ncbi:MAG TPA: PfkB family carbohydrate kinase [Tepidisphaeraceae bacterium]|jgi:sugar/nucleoside kinase (ribokinase family)|nr:PfkB family carbohydrate kinase [Tepidisphaeraceae bacterium]
MPLTRQQITDSASKKLNAAIPSLPSTKATIGLDGFVDEIIAVVDKRSSLDKYDAVPTIANFGAKIAEAAGQSANYELVVKQMKLGGNGPIMANALASFGLSVTYIGALGYPQIHPVFADFAANAKCITIGDAGHTDALEFADGKLMLGKYTCMNDVTWETIVSRVGAEKLQQLVNESKLVGFVNWTMLPFLSQVWEKLRTEVFSKAPKAQRTFFVDLADPEKRTHDDIRAALEELTKFQASANVILGLNLKESVEILEVLHLPVPKDPEAAIEETAKAIRAKMNIGCVVVHPRRGAAAATATESATFMGPFVQQPKISTGAGDHFNAGFALGQVIGLDLVECLCTGVATSGYYVRTAHSPTGKELADFIAELPAPQS